MSVVGVQKPDEHSGIEDDQSHSRRKLSSSSLS